jgi:hypothetical protein
VLGPSWVQATNVAVFANGTRILDRAIEPQRVGGGGRGVKASLLTTIPRPAHDAYLVAVATGPDMPAPFWALPKPYQPTSPKWIGRVIAATNPIWLDADGDRRFSAPREYAEHLIQTHGGDPDKLIAALASFDEATAVQVASLCLAKGIDVRSAPFQAAIAQAPPPVRRGVESVIGVQ